MLVIEISIPRMNAVLMRIPKLGAAIERVAQERMQKTVDTVRELVQQQTPVATGLLRGSIVGEVRGRTAAALVEGVVRTGVIYAPHVEFGRKPGKWPPLAPIREWVIVKGLANSWGMSERSVVYLVRRAIGTRGTIERFKYKGAFMFGQVSGQVPGIAAPLRAGLVRQAIADIWKDVIQKALAMVYGR